jgi:hypothetical protein
MASFRLQFPVEQVREYADRYSYDEDDEVLAVGRAAKERGYYTREEFIAVCRWKTSRSQPLVALNSSADVEEATRAALGGASERDRVRVLRGLRGVDWATASVLLHVAFPERYPILDWRALHALGVRQPSAYSFRFWWAYVEDWRCLSLRLRAAQARTCSSPRRRGAARGSSPSRPAAR